MIRGLGLFMFVYSSAIQDVSVDRTSLPSYAINLSFNYYLSLSRS